MWKSIVSAAIALLVLTGCAIHPLPEDFSGVDTPDIVKRIRCETRDAVQTVVIAWVDKLAQSGDPIAQQLSATYAQNREATSQFGPELFPGRAYDKVRTLIRTFYRTGVAYNFDLNITEDNDLTSQANLLRVLPEHVFRLNVGAGALRKRSNQRTFTVTDTFEYLLKTLNDPSRGSYCNGQIVAANYIYPITGRIGVEKLVKDFIELTLFGNLAGSNNGAVPAMTDKLVFTTTLNASATPSVVFTRVTTAFDLADAQLTASAKRSDVHQVAIALALTGNEAADLATMRTYLFTAPRAGGAPTAAVRKTGGGSQTLYVGDRVTGGGTPSEVLAVIAIDQMKRRELQLYPAQ
ncbi:hypothetical protein [Rhodopseudomonas palustris]|uniref:hypothetical protein n=1 Tax=Rhodopseudomonas palustris TaxID=1076 RepID=UPI000D1A2A28|nr:hypothetical protein [Rhodopseudomonas palustris]AVT80650.1 hypothetical protein RPYSC3_17880 [Rhodopseudomonas palustris]